MVRRCRLLLHLPLVQPIRADADSLGLANGMSFLRLGLAPVLACGWAWAAPGTSAGFITAGLVAGLALTDLLDGLAARLQKRITRLGVGLDPFADLIFFGCLLVAFWPVWIFVDAEFEEVKEDDKK